MKCINWVYAALFFGMLAAGCGSGATQPVAGQTPKPPEKTALTSPTPLPQNKPEITPRPGWKVYSEQRLGVIFQLPDSWKRVERNGALHEFEGQDGFLTFGSIISPVFSNEPVAEICHKEIELAEAKYQALGQKPYGEHPKIANIQVDHQEACLILPSADQDTHFEGESLLVSEYPAGFTLESGQPEVFSIEADKDHIESIAETIRFIPREFGQ